MTSSAAPDNFMDMVGPMVASGDFTSLIDYCSLVELQMASAGAELAAGADVRMLLLAAQLVCGDLNAARFTWKRTPENIRSSSPELRALWEVGKCMWQQKPCVEAIAAFAWSPLIQQLLFLVQNQELERVMSLFARSYSTLRADTLAARTGLSVENAVQVAVDRYGWSYDKSAALLQPAKASPAPAANARDNASARLNPENTQVPLDFLQGIVSHLEQ